MMYTTGVHSNLALLVTAPSGKFSAIITFFLRWEDCPDETVLFNLQIPWHPHRESMKRRHKIIAKNFLGPGVVRNDYLNWVLPCPMSAAWLLGIKIPRSHCHIGWATWPGESLKQGIQRERAEQLWQGGACKWGSFYVMGKKKAQ